MMQQISVFSSTIDIWLPINQSINQCLSFFLISSSEVSEKSVPGDPANFIALIKLSG